MKKIEVDGSGRLNVPDTVEIPFIEGDGVGAEITPVMQSVVDAAVGKAYGRSSGKRCWPARKPTR